METTARYNRLRQVLVARRLPDLDYIDFLESALGNLVDRVKGILTPHKNTCFLGASER